MNGLGLAHVRTVLSRSFEWDKAAQAAAAPLYAQALVFRLPWPLVFSVAFDASGFNPGACRGDRRGLMGVSETAFARLRGLYPGLGLADLFEAPMGAMAGCALLSLWGRRGQAAAAPDWRRAVELYWPGSWCRVRSWVELFERGGLTVDHNEEA